MFTHLRVGRSILNDHAYSINKSVSPECICHAPRESPGHVILKCFLYIRERLTLMSKVGQILLILINSMKRNNLTFYCLGISQITLTFTNITNPYKLQLNNILYQSKDLITSNSPPPLPSLPLLPHLSVSNWSNLQNNSL